MSRDEEDLIQSACVQLLDTYRVFYFSVPNENIGNKAWRAKLARLGLKAGVADLVLLFGPTADHDEGHPRVVFVEIKTPNGRQSKHQRRFQDAVEALGYDYHIVRSVEAMNRLIKEYR